MKNIALNLLCAEKKHCGDHDFVRSNKSSIAGGLFPIILLDCFLLKQRVRSGRVVVCIAY